jgi:hypothetical protein
LAAKSAEAKSWRRGPAIATPIAVSASTSTRPPFRAFSFAGDDWRVCRDHICERLGIAHQPQKPNQHAARPLRTAGQGKRKVLIREMIEGIARQLVPLRGTPGERYLAETRRIDTAATADILERADAIGWHRSVLFREAGRALDGKRLGCIVGVMTDPVTAKPTGAISRTYIHEGRKIGKAKTLGSPVGIVRLSPDEPRRGAGDVPRSYGEGFPTMLVDGLGGCHGRVPGPRRRRGADPLRRQRCQRDGPASGERDNCPLARGGPRGARLPSTKRFIKNPDSIHQDSNPTNVCTQPAPNRDAHNAIRDVRFTSTPAGRKRSEGFRLLCVLNARRRRWTGWVEKDRTA